MHSPATNHDTSSYNQPIITSKGLLLNVINHAGGIIEYRVERVPPSQNVKATAEDVIFLVVVGFLVKTLIDTYNGTQTWYFQRIILTLFAFLYTYARLTSIHHESALAYPTIGLQLETHRGLTLFEHKFTTGISRVFTPMTSISDVIINEGLCGWNVKRYLAVLPAREPRLQVIFQDLDPPFKVIREVYHGLRETLFDEWNDDRKP